MRRYIDDCGYTVRIPVGQRERIRKYNRICQQYRAKLGRDPQDWEAARLLGVGGTVCAICGATVTLANAGLLDQRPHTSNGAGFLEAFCPSYKGQPFFVDAPSVSDGSLITAGATGALMWTKQILERLDVFSPDTLRAWYDYFSTGEAQSFFALMQSLPSAR